MSSKTNKRIRDDRVKSIYNHLVDWEELGVEIFKINDYQYRFVYGHHQIDYFPTSGKYHDLSRDKWGRSLAYKIIDLFDVPKPI